MTRGRSSSWTIVRGIAALAVVPRLVRTVASVRRPHRHEHDPGARPADVAVESPRISVVVPARDESERIVPLLNALHDAPDVIEVVVVDDRSSDTTAAVARGHGARVVDGRPSPDGWAGKTWALDQGVRAATGEWVVCLDADTRPTPELPQWLVARARADGLDLASVGGVAELPGAARWLHAAMLGTLVYRFGGPGAAAAGRELVNGQCVAFRRQALLDAGGFSSVAGAVTEDVALARSLARRGWSVRLLDGGDRLIVEPYGSLRAVWHGWGRSIGLPGVEARGRVMADAAVLALTMVVPVVRLARRSADALDCVLLVARFGTLAGMRSAYRDRGVSYWLSPLADPVAIVSIVASAGRRSVSWRGRRLPVVAHR
jgi:dolichol-phosphate mannosyltransferase